MTTFRDLKDYLDHDGGWEEVPNRSRGGSRGGDHWRYRKALPDGRVLRTKVSRSLGSEIGASLLGHIVRDQLEATMDEFRAVASGQRRKPRPDPVPEPVPIPGWLVIRLVETVGLAESVVGAMSPDEARATWRAYTDRPQDLTAE
ncbi:MAG: cytotoxic translational repressor of toxin-antitoxin stability system [Candidatus Limnocylindria bacterium]